MNKKIIVIVSIVVLITVLIGLYLKSEYTKSTQNSVNLNTHEADDAPQVEVPVTAPTSAPPSQPNQENQYEQPTNNWQIRFTSQDAINIARQAGVLEGVPDYSLPTPDFLMASSTSYGMAWFFRTPSFAKVNTDDCPPAPEGTMKTARYDVEVNAHSGEIYLKKLCGWGFVDF